MNNEKQTEWTGTESAGLSGFKFNFNDVLLAQKELEKINKPQSSIFGIPVYLNHFVPEGEIWCVNNKETIFKIINIGNSKLYRFILWWQNLIKTINKLK